jgi:phenylalanyl-tRNA synthetase beta chain
MAVIFWKKLKPLNLADLNKYNELPAYPISIENKKDCLAYSAMRVEGISKKNASYEIQARLFYCGINTHGFLVDLTNYVMLDIGQPNHAFDMGRVGKISVGNYPVAASGATPSKEGEPFFTLKDHLVRIDESMLFIKSDGKPVALAGIIGGKNSEICAGTSGVVFEFATFDAAGIRRTASNIGVRTDSSARFEKSLDTNLGAIGMSRMIKLIESDKAARITSRFSQIVTKRTEGREISVDKKYLERFCGCEFDYKRVMKNLEGLGFNPIMDNDKITVKVPTWRATKDVTCAADVIEEIVRTIGYDNIVPRAPRAPISPLPIRDRREMRLQDLLVEKYGCVEVHTHIFSSEPNDIRVVNACVKGVDYLRRELVPSLFQAKGRVFEIGQVYDNIEKKKIGIVFENYKELAECVQDLFSAKFELSKAKQRYLHPKNNALIFVDGALVGFIGAVVGKKISVAEIDLDALPCVEGEGFARKSKYPFSSLAFTIDTEKVYGDVEKVFENFQHEYLQSFALKSVFDFEGVKAYNIEFIIGSFERTLANDDIQDVWGKIADISRKNGFIIRNLG